MKQRSPKNSSSASAETVSSQSNHSIAVASASSPQVSGDSAVDVAARAKDDLPWTGARLVTSCRRPLVYEHLHRYAVACTLAEGKRVLDIACGEGYGANLLARVASSVIGVDIDGRTVEHARSKYQHRNLRFLEGSCTEIPCEDHSVDLVTSFETIEHIAEHKVFLAEIKRVLVPRGVLIISSPDKAEYRRISVNANPFHEAELGHAEFVQLMRKSFRHCISARQRLAVGSWIAPDEPSMSVATATYHGGFDGVETETGVYRGVYSLAVCSDRTAPTFSLGMFEDLRVTHEVWNLLDSEEAPSNLPGLGNLRPASERLAELSEAFEEKCRHVAILEREVAEGSRHALQSRQAFEEKAEHVALLQQEIESKNKQITQGRDAFEEKLRHVGILQRELEERSRQLADARQAFEEKCTHVDLLQRDLAESSRHVTHFKEEAQGQARVIDRLQVELQLANDRLSRASSDLLDARWEALTLRAGALRPSAPNCPATPDALELENRAAVAASERDHLRELVKTLESSLDEERACRGTLEVELKKRLKDCRAFEKQLQRVRESIRGRLILPFGRSQKKIRQLTGIKRNDD